jgi:hypothetical protein
MARPSRPRFGLWLRRALLAGAVLALIVVGRLIATRGSSPVGRRAAPASVGTIRVDALSTYAAMRPTVEAESVYLAGRAAVAYTRYLPRAGRVSFPSGTVLDAPSGGVWTVTVGAAVDPTDPTRQVNMLFRRSGTLIRALPAQIPGVISPAATQPGPAQLGDLRWRGADVRISEMSGCSGPACPTRRGAHIPRRYPHAEVTIDTAPLRGATVVAIKGRHMHPDTPYYLETTAGIVGSAMTSAAGALVAIMVIPADKVNLADSRGRGIAVLNGRGWEFIQACLYGGTVTNDARYATCRGGHPTKRS